MKNNSAIRMMFEEGNKLAAKYGRENVFDFSLGNPSVPAPAEVNQAIQDIVKEEDSLFVHGYMSNAGYEDVRETIAQSLNRRFGTSFHAGNILMTVGAASGLNVILKTLLNPGEQLHVVCIHTHAEYNRTNHKVNDRTDNHGGQFPIKRGQSSHQDFADDDRRQTNDDRTRTTSNITIFLALADKCAGETDQAVADHQG